jgi:hypothetical protein
VEERNAKAIRHVDTSMRLQETRHHGLLLGCGQVCLMVYSPSLSNPSFQVEQVRVQSPSSVKSSMSLLTISILSLAVLISLSHGSPLSTSPLKIGTKSRTNATYVSSIDQCPPLSPRQTPPTSVHDLLVIVASMRHPLLIRFL